MNTTTKPDVDNVEQLDFEPECTARIPLINPPCGNRATWVDIKICGHAGLMCDACRVKGGSHVLWTCVTCGRDTIIIEFRRL